MTEATYHASLYIGVQQNATKPNVLKQLQLIISCKPVGWLRQESPSPPLFLTPTTSPRASKITLVSEINAISGGVGKTTLSFNISLKGPTKIYTNVILIVMIYYNERIQI